MYSDKEYFVGIDQSYSSTGVVSIIGSTIDSHAFKAGKPKDPFHVRASELINKLSSVLPEPSKTLVVMEGAAYAAEYNAFMLGELSGALKMFLFQNGYDYEVVQPTTLKKFATGSGNASKAMVMKSVEEKWGFISKSNDICDAFVMAKLASERSLNKKG